MRHFIPVLVLVCLLIGCAQDVKEETPEDEEVNQMIQEGAEKEIQTEETTESTIESVELSIKSVFEEGGRIPQKYTCDGQDLSPPLLIKGIPEEAKTLAIIVDDPDAPMGVFTHWVIWNIPAEETLNLPEGISKTPELTEPVNALQGTNDFKRTGYKGPCPPSGEHRYFFKVYVLDTELDLKPGITKNELLNAMSGHIIQQAELKGVYSR